MEGLSALEKEAPESSLAPSTVQGYSGRSAARRGPSLHHGDILVSRTVRNKFLLFINYPISGILLEWTKQSEWTKTNLYAQMKLGH